LELEKQQIQDYLRKSLAKRPSLTDLENRNIIKGILILKRDSNIAPQLREAALQLERAKITDQLNQSLSSRQENIAKVSAE
jgi:hypothetical protein